MEEITQEVRNVCFQIRADCDNILIGVEILEEELENENPNIKILNEKKEGIETWVGTLDDSMRDLETEIEKIPSQQILNEIENEK